MKIATMMEAMKEEENKAFLFLTLTTPNIEGELVKVRLIDLIKRLKSYLIERV